MKNVDIKEVVCIADVGAVLGEGPLWDPREAALYWLDIKGEKIFRFDPLTNETATFESTGMVSALGLHREGGFVAASREGFVRLAIDEDGIRREALTDPEADKPGNRFNDGKADPAGGFWAGTMDDAEAEASGAWWRLAPDGSVLKLLDGFMVTNGPAFDPDHDRVFLTDSAKRTVHVAETDGTALAAPAVFLQFGEGDGYPDGMEVDAEGCLWIAFWDGACLRRFSPEGRLLQTVDIPTQRPTSMAIVEDALYVTSASIGLDEAARKAAPLSGGLFRVGLDRALGRPSSRFG